MKKIDKEKNDNTIDDEKGEKKSIKQVQSSEIEKKSKKKGKICNFCLEFNSTLISSNEKECYICLNCVETIKNNFEQNQKIEETSQANSNIMDLDVFPSVIIKELNKKVIAQYTAKERLAYIFFKLYLTIKNDRLSSENKNVILLHGPTGSGKTFLVKTLLEYLNISYIISDATSLTPSGFHGKDVEDIIRDIYFQNQQDLKLTENAVVVIDEFDKMMNSEDDSSTVSNGLKRDVQSELLRLIEGKIVSTYYKLANPFVTKNVHEFINTSKMTFIFLGAFHTSLHKFYKKENIETSVNFSIANGKKSYIENVLNILIQDNMFLPELIGRINVFIPLFSFKKEEWKDIIINPNSSLQTEFIRILEDLGFKVEMTDTFLDTVADVTFKNADKFGARYIRTYLSIVFLPLLSLVEDWLNKKYTKVKLENIVDEKIVFSVK